MDLQGVFVNICDFIKLQGSSTTIPSKGKAEDLEIKTPEKCHESGLLQALPFTMRLVCTLV